MLQSIGIQLPQQQTNIAETIRVGNCFFRCLFLMLAFLPDDIMFQIRSRDIAPCE